MNPETATDLKFPDWSGMAEHKTHMNFAQAIEWNEDLLELFPPKPNRAELDAKAKCLIPFVF